MFTYRHVYIMLMRQVRSCLTMHCLISTCAAFRVSQDTKHVTRYLLPYVL
jgi:hypothetical protein